MPWCCPRAAGEWAPPPVQRVKPQVIFCSRTHSQLSQFVGELHRTPFGDSMTLIALGSRKALCINEQVSAPRQRATWSWVVHRSLHSPGIAPAPRPLAAAGGMTGTAPCHCLPLPCRCWH